MILAAGVALRWDVLFWDDLISPALVCGGGKGENFAWCRSESDASFFGVSRC